MYLDCSYPIWSPHARHEWRIEEQLGTASYELSASHAGNSQKAPLEHLTSNVGRAIDNTGDLLSSSPSRGSHVCPRCRTLYCKYSTCTIYLPLTRSLRLFLSPYFSISVAMHYLKTYSDSIGISHYLCWRMKSMRAEEVEGFWPQIW